MSGAFDWLAVGDIAEERADHRAILGGAAARLAAHAAALGARATLVAKLGDDAVGHRLRTALGKQGVDTRWLRSSAPGMRTTAWYEADGAPEQRRLERGADLALRLDELPPRAIRASLTVASGYSLSVEPARSAVLGALAGAGARGGRSCLLLEAELLWWTNARTTRRALEAGLALAHSAALSIADARILFGAVSGRQAARSLAELGPRVIYLTDEAGNVLVRDGARIQECPAPRGAGPPADRCAGPAAFWVGLAKGVAPRQAAADAVRYAASARRPARL